MLEADNPSYVAAHAYLKLCKLDVRDETEKWARTRESLLRRIPLHELSPIHLPPHYWS